MILHWAYIYEGDTALKFRWSNFVLQWKLALVGQLKPHRFMRKASGKHCFPSCSFLTGAPSGDAQNYNCLEAVTSHASVPFPASRPSQPVNLGVRLLQWHERHAGDVPSVPSLSAVICARCFESMNLVSATAGLAMWKCVRRYCSAQNIILWAKAHVMTFLKVQSSKNMDPCGTTFTINILSPIFFYRDHFADRNYEKKEPWSVANAQNVIETTAPQMERSVVHIA